MHLVLKDLQEFEDWNGAAAFLSSSLTHFLKAGEYPPETLPPDLVQRIIVLGANRRIGFHHLPVSAGEALLYSLCRLINSEQEKDQGSPDMAGFLRNFADRLVGPFKLKDVANELVFQVARLFDGDGAAILVLDGERNCLRFVASYAKEAKVASKLTELEVPMGSGIAGWVASNRQPVWISKADSDHRFSPIVDKQTEFVTRELIAAPIIMGERVVGVLEVVSRSEGTFSDWDLPTLAVAATVVGIFSEKANLNVKKQRYAQVADKAEIAHSVLHNIGNVLNSVNVSGAVIESVLNKSKQKQFHLACELLHQHMDHLGSFFENHPKGKLLPEYFIKLEAELQKEHQTLKSEIAKMIGKTNTMRDIIETQQSVAKMGSEAVQNLESVIEEALGIQQELLDRHAVQVVRSVQTGKPVLAARAKLVHILVNLFKNGIEAMLAFEERQIHVEVGENAEGFIYCSIRDTGMGFEEYQKPQLFNHGFTTKENGHGFGLSSCLKAMKDMGGEILAESDGPNRGSTFTLFFPPLK